MNIRSSYVAIEHPRWGETGVAFIVAKPGVVVDCDAVLPYCRERLAPFKVPCDIRVVKELPRSFVGKLDRARLRAIASSSPNDSDLRRP